MSTKKRDPDGKKRRWSRQGGPSTPPSVLDKVLLRTFIATSTDLHIGTVARSRTAILCRTARRHALPSSLSPSTVTNNQISHERFTIKRLTLAVPLLSQVFNNNMRHSRSQLLIDVHSGDRLFAIEETRCVGQQEETQKQSRRGRDRIRQRVRWKCRAPRHSGGTSEVCRGGEQRICVRFLQQT